MNVYILVFERKHYSVFYSSVYEQHIVSHKHLNQNTTLSLIETHPKISPYYIAKYNADTNFIALNKSKSEKELIEHIKANYTKKDSLFIGIMDYTNPNYLGIINQWYPNLIKQYNYVNGTSYLFTKNKFPDNSRIIKPEITDTSKIVEFSGSIFYKVNADEEWPPSIKINLNELPIHSGDYIIIYSDFVTVKKDDNWNEIYLVAELKNEDSTLVWRASSAQNYIRNTYSSDAIASIVLAFEYPKKHKNNTNKQLHIYYWNKGKKNILIDDYRISILPGNKMVYGWYEKIR